MYNHLCNVNIPEELEYLGPYIILYVKYTQGSSNWKNRAQFDLQSFQKLLQLFYFNFPDIKGEGSNLQVV